jgi:hypothetical protein
MAGSHYHTGKHHFLLSIDVLFRLKLCRLKPSKPKPLQFLPFSNAKISLSSSSSSSPPATKDVKPQIYSSKFVFLESKSRFWWIRVCNTRRPRYSTHYPSLTELGFRNKKSTASKRSRLFWSSITGAYKLLDTQTLRRRKPGEENSESTLTKEKNAS